MPYQPRRTLAGFTAEQSASIYHAMRELADEARASRDASVAILTERVELRANQFARLSPPASGQVAVLPHPLRTSPGDEVTLSIEAPLGALTVAVAPARDDTGQISQGTINGQRRLTFVESGEARFRSNGKDRWLFAAEVPAEVQPAASSAVSAAASAALGARYHVHFADASLPNARVATTSPEIEVSNATPGLVSWILQAGSVALSKLANLTGLSVLGRAANSSGVMAAITATAADQLLRNNAAGTSLEWGQATTGSYADASVTLSKIQDVNQHNILCRTGGGNGVCEQLIIPSNSMLMRAGSGSLSTVQLPANCVVGRLGSGSPTTIASSAANQILLRGSGSLLFAQINDDSCLARYGSGTLASLAFSALARDGLTYASGSGFSVGAATGARITVNADDIAWSGFDLAQNGGAASVNWVGVDMIDSSTVAWTLSFPASGLAGLALGVVDGSIDSAKVDLTDDYAWTGGHEFEETLFLAGVFSTTLAAQADDLAIGAVNTVKITLTGAQSLTGMAPVADGQLVFLSNVDTTDALTLVHESASSTAANRLRLPAGRDMAVFIGGGVLLRYDGDQSRWVVAMPQSEGISVSHSPTTATARRSLTFTEGSGIDVTMTTPSTSSATIDVAIDLAEDLDWTGDYTHAGANTLNGVFTCNNAAILNGAATLDNTVRFSGEFQTTLAAQADNLAIGNVSTVHISLTGSQNLSGMAGGSANRVVHILNSDNADTLTILHDSTSTAANRFVCPGASNYAIPPLGGVVAQYNSTRSRWQLLAG